MSFLERVDPTRIEFDDSVTSHGIEQLARKDRVKVLQCSAPVRGAVWAMLNECFFAVRPDVQLRVYGHDSTECDLGFARSMTNVRRFAADCLMRARNVEAIAEIPHLESLSLGIYELDAFSVLERVPATVTTLSLGATRSRKPGLAPLRRFRALRVLYLEGHRKDIDVLGELRELEDVTLRSITTSDLSYLNSLPNLWSLDIKLGGIRSFMGIDGKESIRYLELWQILGLRRVDVVAALPGLQNLFLQSLPRVDSLPSLRDARELRRVVLQNLRGLHDFRALETAPALEEFALIQGDKQTPEELLPVLRNPSVRRVAGGLGSDRKNRIFARLREEHGKLAWGQQAPFEYRHTPTQG